MNGGWIRSLTRAAHLNRDHRCPRRFWGRWAVLVNLSPVHIPSAFRPYLLSIYKYK